MLKVNFSELCINGDLVDCEGCRPNLTISEKGGRCVPMSDNENIYVINHQEFSHHDPYGESKFRT
jgi:hypothetical protein